MFPMLPDLHPDPHFSGLLNAWGAGRLEHPTAAARRLFETLEDFQAFMHLAFPGTSLVSQSGPNAVVTTLLGQRKVSLIAVLNELSDWDVGRSQLPQAAYLLYEADELRSQYRGHVLQEPGAEAKAKLFLKQHEGISTDDLRVVYLRANWRDGDAARWLRAGLRAGVPAADLAYFISGAVGRVHIALWEPEKLAELLASGVPRDYLREFWSVPGFFYKSWEAGLPLEYAIAAAGVEQ